MELWDYLCGGTPLCNLSFDKIVAWTSDKIGAITGRITVSDYERIKAELIEGMRKAGATDAQISQAIAELNRQVDSAGGTVITNPPATWTDVSHWLWLLAFAVLALMFLPEIVRGIKEAK